MDRVRLGYVRYLNTLPLVEGLDASGELELLAAVPAKLGAMLERDEVDIALASVVDFASSAVPLALLPVGGIGCDGPTLTVRLFSQVPLEQVTTLHADTDSHTSVLLAQVLLRRCYGRLVSVVDFDARERVSLGVSGVDSRQPQPGREADTLSPPGPGEGSEWPQTLLLIGDKVVTDSPPAVRYPHQLDLGEAWKGWTGLPFVYACWMCRAQRAAERSIRTCAALLDYQRRRNLLRTQWLIDRAVDQRRWPRDLATRYVTDYLRYDVGPEQRHAVERFLAECASLGFLPARRATWADLAPSERLSIDTQPPA